MLNTLYFFERVEQIMLTNLRYGSFYVKLKKKDNKITELKSSQSSRLKELRIHNKLTPVSLTI